MNTQHHYTSINGQPPQWGSGTAQPQPTPTTAKPRGTDLRTVKSVAVRLVHDDRIHTGFDLSSIYVEEFWTSVLGPSSILLLRRIARIGHVTDSADYHHTTIEELGQPLGLGASATSRIITRLIQFKIATIDIHDGESIHLSVPSRLRPLAPNKARRLSPDQQHAHTKALQAAGIPATAVAS